MCIVKELQKFALLLFSLVLLSLVLVGCNIDEGKNASMRTTKETTLFFVSLSESITPF